MKGIEIKGGTLLYYGNPAGYQEQGGIVTADPIFRRMDLEDWLTRNRLEVQWIDGVYDRLSSGTNTGISGSPLKSCRVWRLKSDSAIERFISLEQMRAYGGPSPEKYQAVFDGQIESNDLEEIWNKLSRRPLDEGYPLSISDVIELYDLSSSQFFYVDRTQIVPIPFQVQRLEDETNLNLSPSF